MKMFISLKNFLLIAKTSVEKLTVSRCGQAFYHSNKSRKKFEDILKKRLNYYVENELPDKSLEAKLASLKSEIKNQVV